MLKPGLYEQVINHALSDELDHIPQSRKAIAPIDQAESSKILSQYLANVFQKALDRVKGKKDDLTSQIELTNQIVNLIQKETQEADFVDFEVDLRAEQLFALLKENDPRLVVNQTANSLERPETSIAQSSLFTGAKYEPQMFMELKKEIASANRIDILVSFIKWTGLRLIIDELKEFTQNGGELRIITTSYMGATDAKAIEELRQLSHTKIKVSYNTKSTRLHAKAYVFYRDTGFSTAYVGSSNISNAALTSGLEWNTKVTKQDLPEIMDKISATFEYYWNDKEFEYYDEGQKERLAKALKAEKYLDTNQDYKYTLDIQPYAYQQEILDQLEAERTVRGYMKNLVVAATGTGKTVISALDYKRFCHKNSGQPCRLLFVAHREEILKQSLYTFRAVLKDANFGEMFVGNYKPENIDHLFISIQTLNSQSFTEKTEATFYDYIIVDEFHHAAAPSYQKLLGYYHPTILLGLTATPERMDGKSILSYFNQRIAAEIRLPEAIDRKLLCPFQYFGVTDTVDLNDLKWTAGGYQKSDLEQVYTYSAQANRRANHVVASVLKYVTDIDDVKGLGFCVTVEHAKFMSHYFNAHQIPAMCLSGQSSSEERRMATNRLVSGEVRFIFVVDIYNEGVDIPEVNTVLFLRPTESLTIFLQQLGRGLRLAENKECLTVLDFIGQANRKYNFEDKFTALLSNTANSMQREIKNGFVNVPKGCYIQLEKKATKYILDNIKASYGNVSGLISRVRSYQEDTGLDLTLTNFLKYYHLDPKMIYKFSTFSRICARADVIDNFEEPLEGILEKAFAKFSLIDSRRWILFLLKILPNLNKVEFATLTDCEKRMMQMFYITIWGKAIENWNSEEVLDHLYALSQSKVLLQELIELLQYRFDTIDFIDEPVDLGFDCPLDLHCTYTRDQLLVAMDFMKPQNVREGVKWLPDKQVDVFLVTLNKSDKDYSPTTMYNDYSINERLFHWQSQSTTSESSATGQRYIHHIERKSKVLLFVREAKVDRKTNSTQAYTYLGLANYVKHKGSKPMNITWQLDQPIPAKFLKKTNKLVVG
ncbi:DEAD/DEAH box helicase [Allobaculum stercoricanis]|uniref:DEAD/DEAH box helicase n=1 Tax=Allobaculum stercoricanis TaxID=174709 RepID=UPI0023F46FDF|nr:DEAD/DEAH box helicase [Allobaculum stercoricanis]